MPASFATGQVFGRIEAGIEQENLVQFTQEKLHRNNRMALKPPDPRLRGCTCFRWRAVGAFVNAAKMWWHFPDPPYAVQTAVTAQGPFQGKSRYLESLYGYKEMRSQA